ncbi:hypothetical protein Echvi_4659 [Echinicola vietnamensis DSM 17526]|uniref:Uncharacterized protein n=1 Tax=Echinicola vietnamensis (strain DSM 17526 / LMG 23754 / KMM 6221) TaxID=926556 RepID=L0G734_ECHVK|nr:hypothetical protein Echvi_4659 [Echinicola vietnamensis DSM 17526]
MKFKYHYFTPNNHHINATTFMSFLGQRDRLAFGDGSQNVMFGDDVNLM